MIDIGFYIGIFSGTLLEPLLRIHKLPNYHLKAPPNVPLISVYLKVISGPSMRNLAGFSYLLPSQNLPSTSPLRAPLTGAGYFTKSPKSIAWQDLFCRHCGHPMPAGARFCQKCGARPWIPKQCMELGGAISNRGLKTNQYDLRCIYIYTYVYTYICVYIYMR